MLLLMRTLAMCGDPNTSATQLSAQDEKSPAIMLAMSGVCWNLDAVGGRIWGGQHYGGPWYWDCASSTGVVYRPAWADKLLDTPSFWAGWAATEFDGKIWVGSFWGLAMLNEAKKEARYFNKQDEWLSHQVVRLRAGPDHLYIGTENGLSVYDPKGGKLTTYRSDDGLAGNTVNDIKIVGEKLWLATSGGLSIMDLKGRVFGNISTDHGLPSRLTTSVSVGSDGIAWVGTSRGVCRVNAELGKVDLTITAKDGLPTEWINAIGVAGKTVWIGTAKGLLRYDIEAQTLYCHDDPEDMASNPITDIAVTPQNVWIGVSLLHADKGCSGTPVNPSKAHAVKR